MASERALSKSFETSARQPYSDTYLDLHVRIDRSDTAKLTINGRQMTVERPKDYLTRLQGIKHDETLDSIAGMVAGRVYSLVGDVMKAAKHSDYADPWQELEEFEAEELYEIID